MALYALSNTDWVLALMTLSTALTQARLSFCWCFELV